MPAKDWCTITGPICDKRCEKGESCIYDIRYRKKTTPSGGVVMALSTTIKNDAYKKKLEELEKQGYFWEYKDVTDFWKKRIPRQEYPTTITFLVGNKPYKFLAVDYTIFLYYQLPNWVKKFFGLQWNDKPYFAIKCRPLAGWCPYHGEYNICCPGCEKDMMLDEVFFEEEEVM